MKTDRELLELAAKAAGLKLYWNAGVPYFRPEMELMDFWNPLTDDGDALRLAVKLKFTISRNDCQCCVVVFGDQDHEDMEVSERFKEVDGPEIQDTYAATRRAIVRAAAAIGEAMP